MKPPTFYVHEAPDAEGLARELAAFVAAHLKEGLRERGRAVLAVSGGSSPIPFFKALSGWALDWDQVDVILVDERWVPTDHADSNARLVREHLLQDSAAAARFHPLVGCDDGTPSTLQDSWVKADAMLDDLPWPADVVVLGMGADGHTASLFPHAPELDETLDPETPWRCMAVSAPREPNVPVPRLTLTARAILDTRVLVVLTTGAGKRRLLEQAAVPGDVRQWPIRLALLQDEVPCHLFHAD